MTSRPAGHSIGTVRETSLHAALKEWYAGSGDLLEACVDGFLVDILRGDLLIEIQTRGFVKLKHKLAVLTVQHPVRLVYPIAQERWILHVGADGCNPLSRRKSPKRGRVEQLFAELVSFPQLLAHPNFSIEVLLTRDEEIRRHDGRGSWRHREWSIHDRRLLDVVERVVFSSPSDLRGLLPSSLPQPFTSGELAAALGLRRRLAQAMVYCLHRMGLLGVAGKRGRGRLYVEQSPSLAHSAAAQLEGRSCSLA